MAEATHLLGLPLKHKKSDVSDFSHAQMHQLTGSDEINVAGLSGSVTQSAYPAVLSGKTRTIKVRDHEGNFWYISGSAYDTYTAPTGPSLLSSLTWTNISYSNSGILSSGAAQNFVNFYAGKTLTNQIARVTTSFTGSTNNFGCADSGSLIANVNAADIDAFYLGQAFDEANRETAQTYTPSSSASANIKVNGIRIYNSYPPYQTGAASINILTTDILAGENKIQLLHTGSGGGAFGSGSFQFFNDTGSAVGINTPTVNENATSSAKFLSGVKYYSTNDQFYFMFTGSRLFETTFKLQPAAVTCTAFAIASYNLNYSDSTEAWNTSSAASVPCITGSYTYSGSKTVATSNVFQHAPTISVTVSDPIGNSATAASSTSTKWIINTYGTASTATAESFVDENRRLYSGAYDNIPSAVSAVWTSSAYLQSYDAVVTGSLAYPSGSTLNFSSGYRPTQTINYSTGSGNTLYFRAMSGSTSTNQGTLTIGGITYSDFQSGASGYANFMIHIKIPTQTAWLDLGSAYNSQTFNPDTENCGCCLSQSGTQYTWATGTRYTGDGGYMYILRVTMFTGSASTVNNKRITSLSESALG